MADPTDRPKHYRLVYSEAVRAVLRGLAVHAIRTGRRAELRVALERLEDVLRVYPQYGDPLHDLKVQRGHVRICTFGPLTFRYAVFEESRIVVLGYPPIPLPNSGF